MTDGAGHSQLGIVRGCPLKTGRDSCVWHGSGTTDEDNVRATGSVGITRPWRKARPGGRRPRWQASTRRRGSTRLDLQPCSMRVSRWSKTEMVKGPPALGLGCFF
jgi:hypothetical protein